MIQFLGSQPGRAIHRLGAIIGSVWLTSTVLNLFWPAADQVVPSNSPVRMDIKGRSLPNRMVSILIIGETGYTNNQNGPGIINKGKISSEEIKIGLLQIKRKEYINIYIFEENKRHYISQNRYNSLLELKKSGDIRLISDLLKKNQKDLASERYIILTQKEIKYITESLIANDSNPNTIETNHGISIERSKEANIDTDTIGDIFLTGSGSYDKAKDNTPKLKLLIIQLITRVKEQEELSMLRELATNVYKRSKTNLTSREMLSLIEEIANGGEKINFEVKNNY